MALDEKKKKKRKKANVPLDSEVVSVSFARCKRLCSTLHITMGTNCVRQTAGGIRAKFYQ